MKLSKIIFFSLLVLWSCSEKRFKNKASKQKLVLEESVSQFYDSLFFGDIKDIEIDSSSIFLADFNQNKVFVTDMSLNLLGYFGVLGREPSDFNGSMNIKVKDKIIYVADDGSRSFKLFDNHFNHLKNIPFPSQVSPYVEFDVDNQKNIYIYTRRNRFISKIISDSKKSQFIGNFKEQFILNSIDRNNSQTNTWHIIYNQDTIIAVNKCEPIILKFLASTNELIDSYNLSKIYQLEGVLSHVNKVFDKEPFNPGSYILFWDVVFTGKSLFLLFINHTNKKPNSNEILEIELLKNNMFKVKNHFSLSENGWYECIAIFNNKIFAYNRDLSSIESFAIP